MERNPQGGNRGLQAGRYNRFSRAVIDKDRPGEIRTPAGRGPEGEEGEGDGKLTINICISGEDAEKRKRPEENDEFEEVNYLEEFGPVSREKPMITFSHVSSVTENEKISFDAIRKSHSRSESPLLEVPHSKIKQNEPLRPPL